MGATVRVVATTAFGLERVVKHELLALGFEPAIGDPGRVGFDGSPADVATANVWLRAASRVVIELASFRCRDFDELYEGIRKIGWRDLLPPNAAIGVQAALSKSAVDSQRHTQSITKRAIVDSLVGRGGSLDESGPACTVAVGIRADRATVSLDTSGPGLHRRGYRPNAGPGQLKETLAAGIVQLTRWTPDRPLIDPFCGQGTIAIEAAMLAAGLAPGANRVFAGEALPWIPRDAWADARAQASDAPEPAAMAQIMGRDIDDGAIGEARRAAERAGVRGLVGFRLGDFRDTPVPAERGWLITNPPYGLRVLELEDATRIHAGLPGIMDRLPRWSHAILTAYPGFERLIGQAATKRRKLYNGSIECGLYLFHPTKDGAPARRAGPSAPPGPRSGSPVPDLGSFTATLAKRARHLRRWPERHALDCFRVYDGQAPGVGIAIDRIGPVFRVTLPAGDRSPEGLSRVLAAAAETLGTDTASLRIAGPPGCGTRIEVREGGLRFSVVPEDPATGPLLDRRAVRGLIAEWASGRGVLHLHAGDPGSPAAAAIGPPDGVGAAYSLTVADHAGCIAEARRAVRENNAATTSHELHAEAPFAWLHRAGGRPDRRFDLAVIQPPTPDVQFSKDAWRRSQDDTAGIVRGVWAVLAPGGRVLLVTPGSRNRLPGAALPGGVAAHELTGRTVTEDYTHSRPHRSWLLTRGGETRHG